MVKKMDGNLEVSKFQLYLHHYVNFQMNTLKKDMKPLFPQLWVK